MKLEVHNSFTEYLATCPMIDSFHILGYFEKELAPAEMFQDTERRACGMVLLHRRYQIWWAPLFIGQSGRRYFKDGRKRLYVE